MAGEFRGAFPEVPLYVESVGEPWLKVHETPLRNLFRNLLHNAMSAAQRSLEPTRNVTVTVVGSNSDDDELSRVDIVISNDCDVDAPRDESGTGIGVASAKEAINNLGGTFEQVLDCGHWKTSISLPGASF